MKSLRKRVWQNTMAGCKKKRVKIAEMPKGKSATQKENPDDYYHNYPSWRFSRVDTMKWAITKDAIGDAIWDEIFLYLKSMENRKWGDILVSAKKQNHSIDWDELTKVARDRLDDLHIENESIISLRITATHRIYGYIRDSGFYLLWYDTNHGDNKDCVCRSSLKHT